MGLRERKKQRPYVGQTMASVFLGSPEERRGLGSPEERVYLGSPEELPPVLTRGATGRWVVYVQQKLGVVVTGVYDAQTEAAVCAVQSANGLPRTCVTDLPTWSLLARLPGFGFGQLATPYGSYGPYGGGYFGGYPYTWWRQTFFNPSRGSSSSGGGGRGPSSAPS